MIDPHINPFILCCMGALWGSQPGYWEEKIMKELTLLKEKEYQLIEEKARLQKNIAEKRRHKVTKSSILIEPDSVSDCCSNVTASNNESSLELELELHL